MSCRRLQPATAFLAYRSLGDDIRPMDDGDLFWPANRHSSVDIRNLARENELDGPGHGIDLDLFRGRIEETGTTVRIRWAGGKRRCS